MRQPSFHSAGPAGRAILALLLLEAVWGCAGSGADTLRAHMPTCGSTVKIDQVIDRRTLRLADGKIVEITEPKLFLPEPSPNQPDSFALNEELVAFLRSTLTGRTVTADLSGTTIALCGQDLVAVGTGLVTQGLIYLEQATGPLEAENQESWKKLETLAKQNTRGLWKKGAIGRRPFERVARLTHASLTGEQTLQELSSDGFVLGAGRQLTPQNLELLHTIVAGSAIVILPRSANFWQLCCDITGTWFRVYYPHQEGHAQEADYIESAELETFFRRIFDNGSTP